ncbi:MAG: hypothetical protein Q4A61_05785 [Porphyromonadaceae bacterium]|nr:hypothetical protein [Porphyromonadaceae bacterium]
MKTIFSILLIALTSLSLMGQSLSLTLGGIDLVIYGAKETDFQFGHQGDTVLIRPIEQAPLDSAYLQPREGVEIIDVEERLKVDFVQETLDFEPAFALGSPHEYRLYTTACTRYHLKSISDVRFEPQHIKRTDAASRQAQTKYYKHFLATKADQPELYPEYILEAEHFLRKRNTLPFDELRTMPIITGRLLILRYRELGRDRKLIIKELDSNTHTMPGEVVVCRH